MNERTTVCGASTVGVLLLRGHLQKLPGHVVTWAGLGWGLCHRHNVFVHTQTNTNVCECVQPLLHRVYQGRGLAEGGGFNCWK